MDHHKLWKILKEMGIPDHLTCLLRNLCTRQEATVRTGHGTIDSFQIRFGLDVAMVPQDWKRSVFIPIPKKGNDKKCSNYRTIALISYTSKVMIKIF